MTCKTRRLAHNSAYFQLKQNYIRNRLRTGAASRVRCASVSYRLIHAPSPHDAPYACLDAAYICRQARRQRPAQCQSLQSQGGELAYLSKVALEYTSYGACFFCKPAASMEVVIVMLHQRLQLMLTLSFLVAITSASACSHPKDRALLLSHLSVDSTGMQYNPQ